MFEGLFGKADTTAREIAAIPAITQYAKWPPITCFWIPNAKAELTADGPIARTTDISICVRPFVAPIEARFGAAELT